jgi:hypothetical protein
MSQDADLIEILWKQDIDIGVPRDHFLFPEDQESSSEDVDTATLKDKLDLKVEKLQFFLFEKRNKKWSALQCEGCVIKRYYMLEEGRQKCWL